MSASGASSSGLKLNQRLKVISDVDQKITELVKHAQACILELSREKQVRYSRTSFYDPPFSTVIEPSQRRTRLIMAGVLK